MATRTGLLAALTAAVRAETRPAPGTPPLARRREAPWPHPAAPAAAGPPTAPVTQSTTIVNQ